MTREEFKEKAKEVIDKEQFGSLGVLFDYESFEEMKVAQIPDSLDSATSDMPLDDFLDKLYEQIKQDSILDKIIAEIQGLRNCSCSCSDGIIDDVEDIIDKYKAESEDTVNKTGHWIDIMVGDMPAQACDQCNTFYPLAYTGGGHKYCPNCGTKMSEFPTGSESEDKYGNRRS